MSGVFMLDLDNNIMDPAEFFGRDVARIFNACYKVMHGKLYPYEGCYHAKDSTSEEVDKQQRSREKWKEEWNKLFRVIYGVAKNHKIYIEWCGNDHAACCPDRWIVWQRNKVVGRICCG